MAGRKKGPPVRFYKPIFRGKESPFYWVDYTDPDGQRVQRTTRCSELEAAQRIGVEWYRAGQHEAADRAAGIERPSDITLEALADEWIDYMRPRRKPRYVAALEDNIRAYITPFFGATVEAATLTKKHIEGFDRAILSGAIETGATHVRRSKVLRPGTRNRIMSTLRGLLKYGVKQGYLAHEASAGVRKLAERTEEVYRALDDEEIAAHLEQLGKARTRTLMHTRWYRFVLEVGFRDDETDTLQWPQLRRDQRCAVMGAAQTKGGYVRRVPLTDVAVAILDEIAAEITEDGKWPKVGAVFGEHNRRTALHLAWEKTKLPGRCPSAHDLRETCASRAVARGLDLRELMEMFGWTNPATAARYLNMYGDRWRQMAAKLNRPLP